MPGGAIVGCGQPLLTHAPPPGIQGVLIVHFSRHVPPLGSKGEWGENRTDQLQLGGRMVRFGHGIGLGTEGTICHARGHAAAPGHRGGASSDHCAASDLYTAARHRTYSVPAQLLRTRRRLNRPIRHPDQRSRNPPIPGPASPAAGPFGAPSSPGGAPAFTPAPGYGPAPPATFNGTVQPPPANLDPYATPGTTPSPLLQQDPYFQCGPTISMGTMQKFLQHINLDYHWFAGNGDHELGINDVDLSATFAFPIVLQLADAAAGDAGLRGALLAGPVSVCRVAADGSAAGRSAAARPTTPISTSPGIRRSPPGSARELDVRIGMYSDFSRRDQRQLRFMGKGMAVMTFSPSMKIKAGVWYLDRNVVKLLPAGGICLDAQRRRLLQHPLPQSENRQAADDLGQHRVVAVCLGRLRRRHVGDQTQQRLRSPDPVAATDGTCTTRSTTTTFAWPWAWSSTRCANSTGMFEVGGAFGRELVYQSTLPPDLLSEQHRIRPRRADLLEPKVRS